jgi:hypothetical protein
VPRRGIYDNLQTAVDRIFVGQATRIQPPLPADGESLPHRPSGLHPGRRLGERPGREERPERASAHKAWHVVATSFPEGKVVSGKAVRFVEAGAIVEFNPHPVGDEFGHVAVVTGRHTRGGSGQPHAVLAQAAETAARRWSSGAARPWSSARRRRPHTGRASIALRPARAASRRATPAVCAPRSPRAQAHNIVVLGLGLLAAPTRTPAAE